MSFPTEAFAIVLDFAKGNKTWGVEVFDAILELLKWCYRAIAGTPNVVGYGSPTDSPVEALELLGAMQDPNVKMFNPALVAFVVQYLMGILLEKLKK
jgi:hypothetical protein